MEKETAGETIYLDGTEPSPDRGNKKRRIGTHINATSRGKQKDAVTSRGKQKDAVTPHTSKRIAKWETNVKAAREHLQQNGNLDNIDSATQLYRFLYSQMRKIKDHDDYVAIDGNSDNTWDVMSKGSALTSQRIPQIRPLIQVFAQRATGNDSLRRRRRSTILRGARGPIESDGFLRRIVQEPRNIPNPENVANLRNLSLCQGLRSFVECCFDYALESDPSKTYPRSRCPQLLLLLRSCMNHSSYITQQNFSNVGLQKLTADMKNAFDYYFRDGQFPQNLAALGNF